MRLIPLVVAASATWLIASTTAEARCRTPARYPSTFGAQTYMLATATAGTVRASVGSQTFPAQVMHVDELAGFDSLRLARGLRASGGTAVFVRYHLSPHCAPIPAADGFLDSVGVNGLYVGVSRPEHAWIGGRPTFDIHPAADFPLPQGLKRLNGDSASNSRSYRPMMTSSELFAMYRALWSDSVSARDSTVVPRLLRWVAANRAVAAKHPAQEIAEGMMQAVAQARVAAYPVPHGGTFAITVIAPDVDSMAVSGQTSALARVWEGGTTRDSVLGNPIALARHSFAVYLHVMSASTDEDASATRVPPCAVIVPVIVDSLPIVLSADSTWQGKMLSPISILQCAPASSRLKRFADSSATGGRDASDAIVTFRRHADGRLTFEGRTRGLSQRQIHVRGERTSTATF